MAKELEQAIDQADIVEMQRQDPTVVVITTEKLAQKLAEMGYSEQVSHAIAIIRADELAKRLIERDG